MWGTIERRARDLGMPEKTVILSFDDGPVPEGQTLGLLDVLAAGEVTAAFCLVGRRVRAHAEIVRDIHRRGHLIVNHGELHRLPDHFSDGAFHADLDAFDESVRQALDLESWTSRFYRPPGGRWNRRLERLLGDSGRMLMPVTFFAWDIFAFPFRRKLILEAMLANLRRNQGGLFLLHEAMVPLSGEKDPAPPRIGRRWIPDLVDELVRRARADGFSFIDPREFTP